MISLQYSYEITGPFPNYHVPLFLCFVQNFSHNKKFNFYENENVGGKHFYMDSFARNLVLTQRQKATSKWHIVLGAIITSMGQAVAVTRIARLVNVVCCNEIEIPSVPCK